MNHDRPDGPLSRSFRMGKLGLGLAGSYIGYQLQNVFLDADGRGERKRTFQTKASRRIREELEQLKGPMMKFGQILSMQTQALPEESIRELSQLQMRAPGMHPTLARAQFKAALGKAPEEVFRQFEPEPFAAASLGQVHRATTKSGDAVAVKIQYPAIRTAIENDFKVLRSATLPGQVTGFLPKSILHEIERGFLEETDYLNEARNIEKFYQQLKGLPYMRVPRVHHELTRDRVLTMSHLAGTPLAEFVAAKPSQSVRNLIGQRMLELFHFQRLGIHAVHADPHPGNFLVDAQGNIGLVDFGCVKEFSKQYVELIRCFVKRAWHTDGERDRIVRLLWGADAPVRRAQRHKVLQDAIAFSDLIYPPELSGRRLVDFGDPQVLGAYVRIMNESTIKRLTNPEYAFLVRTELGFYNLLHLLRARLDTNEVIDKVKLMVGF